MGQKLDDMMDTASVAALARQLRRPQDTALDPLDSVHAVHERVRLFCGVLRVLVEDPFQPGHEMMALSLLQCASGELVRMLEWEAADLASALVHERHQDGARFGSVEEFLVRHHQILASIIAVASGLDQISRGAPPSRPAEFAIEALQFVDTLESYLRWQDDILLPLARRLLDRDRLANVTAALTERPDFAASEFRTLSA